MDSDNFHEVLKGEDDLGVVIRSHIHIEAKLNELFEVIFNQPKYLESMNLEYHQKVQIALACGLDERFGAPLNTIGTIRNNFAHKLNAELGKNEVDSIYKSFSGDDKNLIQVSYKKMKKHFHRNGPNSISKLSPGDGYTLLIIALRAALEAEIKRFKGKLSI